jgi:hypothetical protein
MRAMLQRGVTPGLVNVLPQTWNLTDRGSGGRHVGLRHGGTDAMARRCCPPQRIRGRLTAILFTSEEEVERR